MATTADVDGIADVQERTWQAAYRHVFPARELDRGGFIRPERWRGRVAKPPAGWTTFVAVARRRCRGIRSGRSQP